MTASQGTHTSRTHPYIDATGYNVSSIDATHPQSKRNDGRTSLQHQVPDLTTQEDAPYHIPLNNWDITPTPLPRYNNQNKSTSINSRTSGQHQTSIHQGRQVTQTVSPSSQHTEDTHHLCTVYDPLAHHECPNPQP